MAAKVASAQEATIAAVLVAPVPTAVPVGMLVPEQPHGSQPMSPGAETGSVVKVTSQVLACQDIRRTSVRAIYMAHDDVHGNHVVVGWRK